jgi:hypothetical protein
MVALIDSVLMGHGYVVLARFVGLSIDTPQ